eukprot:COSAG02_NODE_35441_length_468_cov_0.994580_2_plen_38_part_01
MSTDVGGWEKQTTNPSSLWSARREVSAHDVLVHHEEER